MLPHTSGLPETEKITLKSKFLNTFHHYNKIKAPYEYQDTINKLSSNKDICLIKQDKGRGIIIMDKSKYLDKCLEILETDKFVKLDEDPTPQFETRVQNCLKRMKKRLGIKTYRQIYPSSSRHAQF